MITDRYVKAAAERKWNYIFLLYARYDGSFARLARAMGVPQAELKNWDVEFREDVMQWIENNKVIRGDSAVTSSDEVPTLEELIREVQKKLKSTIGSADDPAALARALKNLHEVKEMTGSDNNEDNKSDVVTAVEEKLRKKK